MNIRNAKKSQKLSIANLAIGAENAHRLLPKHKQSVFNARYASFNIFLLDLLDHIDELDRLYEKNSVSMSYDDLLKRFGRNYLNMVTSGGNRSIEQIFNDSIVHNYP